MTVFDKICAVLTIPLGFVLLVAGVVGIFTGASANFSLPPILGGIPILFGWAMSVTLIRFWLRSSAASQRHDVR